jgi:hypothetical protein
MLASNKRLFETGYKSNFFVIFEKLLDATFVANIAKGLYKYVEKKRKKKEKKFVL